jgi:hypothetical protein
VNRADAARRVFDAHRDLEPRRRELVAGLVGLIALANVHGHQHAQRLDRCAVLGVVARQTACHRRDERVVDRAAMRLAGLLELLERHRQVVEVHPRRALEHDRRHGLGRRRQHPRHRGGRVAKRSGLGQRIAQRAAGLLPQRRAQTLEALAPLADATGQGITDAIPGRRRRDVRLLVDEGREILVLGPTLDQALGHPDQPDAIADGVVQLHHRRATATLETLDQMQLPERAIHVERLHRDRRGVVEQVPNSALPAQARAAQVETQVEIRVALPPGGRDGKRIPDHSLAQARDDRESARQLPLEARHVGGAVEHPGAEDGRAQRGIGLEIQHQGVRVAQMIFEPHRAGLRVAGRLGHLGSFLLSDRSIICLLMIK